MPVPVFRYLLFRLIVVAGCLGGIQAQPRWICVPDISVTDTLARARAQWLRTTFPLPQRPVSATLTVSAVGWEVCFLNGKRIGTDVLSPAPTDYRKQTLSLQYSVDSLLVAGENALGMVLGNGKAWTGRKQLQDYGVPRVWCVLEMRFADGSSQIIESGPSWQGTTEGQVVFQSEYDGETHDPRKAFPGWASSGFRADGWQPVRVLPDVEQGPIAPQLFAPERVVAVHAPVAVTPQAGGWLLDFGINRTGWARISLTAPLTDTLVIRYAETLNPDGTPSYASLRSARATDRCLPGLAPNTAFEPLFTLHGFRYMWVKGLPQRPDPATVMACEVHSALPETGYFQCSDSLINQVYGMARQTLANTYHGIPMDCPQRDERHGWLGDRGGTIAGERYQWAVTAFYRKWLRDIAQAQTAEGALPNLAPPNWVQYRDNATWPAAAFSVLQALYEQTGDTALLREHAPPLARWMDHLLATSVQGGLVVADQYGDWGRAVDTPDRAFTVAPQHQSSAEIMATTATITALNLLAQWANALGQPDRWSLRATGFGAALLPLIDPLHPENHTATEIICLLAAGVGDAPMQARLAASLPTLFHASEGAIVPCGVVGLRSLYRTLCRVGQQELAVQLATSTRYPSLGYMKANGATTLWESWSYRPDHSLDHPMLLGDWMGWCYENLAGIQVRRNEAVPLILAPVPGSKLAWAAAQVALPEGRVASHWSRSGDSLRWEFTVPPGLRARVEAPVPGFPADTLGPGTYVRRYACPRLASRWRYQLYTGLWSALPDFDTLHAVDSGMLFALEPDSLPAPKDRWGATFAGQLRVPEPGWYRFYLSSDDGSRLKVDGKQAVDNDGVHYHVLRTGTVWLDKGVHPLEIEYFNRWSSKVLALQWSGPQFTRRLVEAADLEPLR